MDSEKAQAIRDKMIEFFGLICDSETVENRSVALLLSKSFIAFLEWKKEFPSSVMRLNLLKEGSHGRIMADLFTEAKIIYEAVSEDSKPVTFISDENSLIENAKRAANSTLKINKVKKG